VASLVCSDRKYEIRALLTEVATENISFLLVLQLV
jgi:hypothetical protein